MVLGKIFSIALLANASSAVFSHAIVLNNDDLCTDLNWVNQYGVMEIRTFTRPSSGYEIQRALSQAKVTHPAQQKVINSVLNALKADNDTVKVGAFAETDIKKIPQA
ncbi:hypothetical protein CEJ64_22885, partial [Acinetobacter baumannii]